jgi:predicted TPR repeat methyltransferase
MSSKQQAERWIEGVYHAKDRHALEQLYDNWAESYDADLQQVGYLHLPVIAGLVSRHVPVRFDAILDAGVGTGAVGEVLALLGYQNLTGLDMSEGMLARARARGCYADLRQGVLGEALDFASGVFSGIVSTGTFTKGHAPAAALVELTRVLKSGGVLMFTAGTSIWETHGFADVIGTLARDGAIELIETTPAYAPMPFSLAESGYLTQAHVYRKL